MAAVLFLCVRPARAEGESPLTRSDMVVGVVTPESAADVAWVRTGAGRPRVNLVPVSSLAAEVARPTSTWRVYLYDRSRAAAWPAEARKVLPVDPERGAPDEVSAWSTVKGKLWEVVIVAPDAAQLRLAWRRWLETPFAAYSKTLGTLFAWKVRQALVVSGDAQRARAQRWVEAQGSNSLHYSIRSTSLAAVTAPDLAGASLVLVLADVHELAELPDPQRALIGQYLPERARAALTGPPLPTVVTAGERRGEQLVLAGLAPHTRFLGATLSLPGKEAEGGSLGIGLTSAESTGSHFDLRELRGVHHLCVVGLGGTPEHSASVADSACSELDQGSGWSFAKDADTQVLLRKSWEQRGNTGVGELATTQKADGVLVVRLKDVSGKTQFRAGVPKCLTNGPAPFTQGEPAKPDPDDRKGFLGGHRYQVVGGSRANDPDYRNDVDKWRSDHADWERAKRDYEATSKDIDCDWEQELLTEYIATADVQIDVVDGHGKVLCTVAGRGRGGRTESETSKQQIHGWGNRPSAPHLQSDRNEAPGTVIQDALKQAAADAVRQLKARSILPADGGEATGAADQDPNYRGEPQPVVPTPSAAPVVPGGEAPQSGTGQPEKSVPPRPRQCTVVVVVPERHLSHPVPDPAVETALNRDFVKAGLKVVDDKRIAALRDRAKDLANLRGNPDLARELQTNYGADILVTGEAFSQEAGLVNGLPNCAARVELKVLDIGTGELIWADSAFGNRAEITVELAAKLALETYAAQQSRKCVEQILHYLQQQDGARRLQVVLRGVDLGFTQADQIQTAVEGLEGVTHVEQVSFTEGLLTLEVTVAPQALGGKNPVRYLAAALEGHDKLKPFGVRVKTVTGTRIEGDLQHTAQ